MTDPCHCQSTGSIFSLGNRRLCPARTRLVLTAPFLNASLTSGEQAVAVTAPSTHALCRALPWAAHPFQSVFFGILQNLASKTGSSLQLPSHSLIFSHACLHRSTPGAFSSYTFSMSSSCIYDCDCESLQPAQTYCSRPICLFSC